MTPHTHDASFPTIHSVDHSFIETPIPAPPPASTSTLRGTVSRRHNADPSTSSDAPDVPPPPFPLPVLDNTSPTSPQLSSDSPTPRPDNASLPESHSSTPAPVPPATCPPWPDSSPDQDVAVKRLDPANGKAAPDYPPESPAPSTSGTAVGGPSRRSLDGEQTGDHHPHQSHDSCDASPNKMDV
ncbi:hypothetical protein H4582DRAFT_1993358 [Lactarius indigo]|nr:hypothetical protein H4582DRAFT_1993358 [Lactarius indigo]